MKSMKSIYFLMLCLGLTLVFSCRKDLAENDKGKTTQLTKLENTKYLTKLISFDKTKTQTKKFKLSEGINFTSESGKLKVNISPKSVYSNDGSTPPEDLVLEVREYLTLSDMLRAGVTTTSNGKILVTGGNFFWKISDSNGNKNYSVNAVEASFKIQTNPSDKYLDVMKLYTGEETVSGNGITQINWNVSRETPNNPNAGSLWAKGKDCILNSFPVRWVNCDALYEIAKDDPTQFGVKILSKESDKVSSARVFFVPKDFPSVVELTVFDQEMFKTYQNSIPKGMKAKLIVLGENADGKLFYADQQIEVKGNDVFEVTLKESSNSEIEQALKSID